jgi:hypothetical protein
MYLCIHIQCSIYVATVKRGSLVFQAFCCYTFVMAGRHKKPEGEAKSYMLRIRMTEEDRALLEAAAKLKSLETSTWARSELVGLARKLLGKK